MAIRSLVPLATLIVVFATTIPASGLTGVWRHRPSLHPRYCDRWAYDNWGVGWPFFYPWNQEAITTRQIYGERQQLGSAIAADQAAAMQSGIRNSLANDAWRRDQWIAAQRQSDRDLVAQSQMQQTAQRQLLAMRYAGMLTPAAAPTTETDPTTPEAAVDVFRWPFVLQAPRFAADRAIVESPYRRQVDSDVRLTDNQRQTLLAAIERMRTTLKEAASRVTADEYFDARAFLDRLAERVRTAPAKTSSKDGTTPAPQPKRANPEKK